MTLFFTFNSAVAFFNKHLGASFSGFSLILSVTKPVIRVHFSKLRCIHHLKAELIICPIHNYL